MSDLDEFLRQRESIKKEQREDAQEDLRRDASAKQYLQEHAKAAWASLKDSVWNESRDKSAHGRPFQKSGNGLILGSVAASFDDGMLVNSVPTGSHIVFGRVPYGHYAEASAIGADLWPVEATAHDGTIAWQTDHGLFLTKDLAEEIVKRLVLYLEEYEAAYGRNV